MLCLPVLLALKQKVGDMGQTNKTILNSKQALLSSSLFLLLGSTEVDNLFGPFSPHILMSGFQQDTEVPK